MSHGKKSKRKKKKHPTGHEHPEGDAKLNNKPEHVHVSGKIETDFPPKLIEKYDIASNKNNGWNRRQFFVSLATAILVFAYTTVAAWQGCSSQKAANAAKSAANTAAAQLELSERPWVGIKGELIFEYLGFTPTQGGPVRLQASMFYTLENTGNSPALKVAESIVPIITVNNEVPNEWRFLTCNSAEAVSSGKIMGGVVVMPKGTTDKPHPNRTSYPIPAEVKRADFIWIAGCITYRDPFIKLHHTKVLYLCRTAKPVILTDLPNDLTPFPIGTVQLVDSDAD